MWKPIHVHPRYHMPNSSNCHTLSSTRQVWDYLEHRFETPIHVQQSCQTLLQFDQVLFVGDSYTQQLWVALLSLISGDVYAGSMGGVSRPGDPRMGTHRIDSLNHQWRWNESFWMSSKGQHFLELMRKPPRVPCQRSDIQSHISRLWKTCRAFSLSHVHKHPRICQGQLNAQYIDCWSTTYNVSYVARVLHRLSGNVLLVIGGGSHWHWGLHSLIHRFWPPLINSIHHSSANVSVIWLGPHAAPTQGVNERTMDKYRHLTQRFVEQGLLTLPGPFLVFDAWEWSTHARQRCSAWFPDAYDWHNGIAIEMLRANGLLSVLRSGFDHIRNQSFI